VQEKWKERIGASLIWAVGLALAVMSVGWKDTLIGVASIAALLAAFVWIANHRDRGALAKRALTAWLVFVVLDWVGIFYWFENKFSHWEMVVANREDSTCVTGYGEDMDVYDCKPAFFYGEKDYKKININCVRKCRTQLGLVVSGQSYALVVSDLPFTNNRVIDILRNDLYD